jgi:cyclopropane fatty-acyl-phospholipid synthase-like methyltransferase
LRARGQARILRDVDQNLNWSFKDRVSQLLAVTGTAYGTDVDEALVKLREFKHFEASISAKDLELSAGDVVAEIGSGYGFWATATSPLVRKVMCLDISPDLLDLCRREVVSRSNIECHLISPGDLSVLRSSGVNKMYSAGVFIHFNIYDVVVYLQQIFEILPHGGRLMFNIANADCDTLFSFDQWQLAVSWYRENKTRLFQLMYFNSPATVTKIAETIGFELKRVRDPRGQYVWFLFEKPDQPRRATFVSKSRMRLANVLSRLESRLRSPSNALGSSAGPANQRTLRTSG